MIDEIQGSDKYGVMSVIAACHHFGVSDVIICPGSRNAPLTVSFNQSGLFDCHSMADERAAAFYALGIAMASDMPVAIVCTSGSAVVNFAPAITEAYYQKVPLIAISADRPLEWTDQGNGQTIRQEGVLDNFVLDSFSIKEMPASEDEDWFNRRKLSEGFNKATVTNRGPLHINVPLSEPLYNTVKVSDTLSQNFFSSISPLPVIAEYELELLQAELKGVEKIMILAGQVNHLHDLNPVLEQWAALPQVVILSETLSNLNCPTAIDTIDRVAMSIENDDTLAELMPDTLITLGGFVVSKKIKAFLRKHKPKNHIHVGEYPETIDTFQSLRHHVQANAELFLNQLVEEVQAVDSDYGKAWLHFKQKAQEGHDAYMEQLPYSDFYAFKEILNADFDFTRLHLSNSSPVRYAQLFGGLYGVHQYANRGTSGIDGCSSTAAGMAYFWSEEQHLLITGDVSFKYDINALWNGNFPENLKIVVINNEGGGIFRIIQGPDTTEEHEEFFEAHHPVQIEHLAKAYGFSHYCAKDANSLSEALEKFTEVKGKAILEVQTPKLENDKVLKGYFKAIGRQFV